MTLRTAFVTTAVALLAANAAAADRLTDRDVKALVSRIEDGRDRFDDALVRSLEPAELRRALAVAVSGLLEEASGLAPAQVERQLREVTDA